MRYYSTFRQTIPRSRAGCSRVTHPFATFHKSEDLLLVRLACLNHAASVHSEPGSNSPKEESSGDEESPRELKNFTLYINLRGLIKKPRLFFKLN